MKHKKLLPSFFQHHPIKMVWILALAGSLGATGRSRNARMTGLPFGMMMAPCVRASGPNPDQNTSSWDRDSSFLCSSWIVSTIPCLPVCGRVRLLRRIRMPVLLRAMMVAHSRASGSNPEDNTSSHDRDSSFSVFRIVLTTFLFLFMVYGGPRATHRECQCGWTA